MATVDITNWTNSIRPVASVPEPSLIEAVRAAARQFCMNTHLWNITLDRITVVANTQGYALTVPTAWTNKAEVVIVDNAKYKQDGLDDDQFITLKPLSVNQSDLHESGSWLFLTAPTPTRFWVDVSDKQINLWKKPTDGSTSGLLVKIVARPTLTATVLPDFLYYDHRDTIRDGALAFLFGQKESKWYDPDKEFDHEIKFRRAYNTAKFQNISGATKRPMTVRYNSGFCP